MNRARVVLCLAATLLAPRSSAAQPLPARMLGKPLPSPDLPRGVVTVKLIGSGLGDIQVGKKVELVDTSATPPRVVQRQTTGSDGRARFSGLQPGRRYVAQVPLGTQQIRSSMFSLRQSGGVRLMLSTKLQKKLPRAEGSDGAPAAAQPPAGAATSDKSATTAPATVAEKAVQSGAARLARSAEVPAGKLQIEVRGATAERPARAGVSVRLSGKKTRLSATTDEKGRALFSLPDEQFSIHTAYGGVDYSTTPIRPTEGEHGLRATFLVFDRTTDRSHVSLGRGTHIVAQVGEERVGMLEVFSLTNAGTELFDPGDHRIELPLPRGAINAELPDDIQNVARLDAKKHQLVLTRPLPPGQLTLRVFFELPYERGALDFHQKLTLALRSGVVAVTKDPGVSLHGPSIGRSEKRAHGGDQTTMYRLRPLESGQALQFTMTHLPERDTQLRTAVLAGAALIVLWGLFASVAGARRRHVDERARQQLLDRLTELERDRRNGAIGQAAYKKKRRKLLDRLRPLWQ